MAVRSQGIYEGRYEPVVAAFEDALDHMGYGGASLAVYRGGKPVVDVWGGIQDIAAGKPWTEDTLAVGYSCSKSITTIVVLHLVEAGRLDLDAPIAEVWPEFANNGKAAITLRQVLSHRAGLNLVDAPLTREDVFGDGRGLVEALEAQKPVWEPGTGHSYHPITMGNIAGEVVRRVTGNSLGHYLRSNFADPLGLDLWIGLPPELHDSVALVLPADPSGLSLDEQDFVNGLLMADDRDLRALTLNGTIDLPVPTISLKNSTNSPEFLEAEFPAANGVGTALAWAKLHAALVDQVTAADGRAAGPILSAATLDDATREQSSGAPIFGLAIEPFPTWGTGFELPWELRPMLGPSSFGHDGMAGGLVFADRDAGIGFAYLPSVIGPIPDVRMNPIVAALADCL